MYTNFKFHILWILNEVSNTIKYILYYIKNIKNSDSITEYEMEL